MANEITKISPEGLEIANAYLQLGNISAVSQMLSVSEDIVAETLNKAEVRRYVDTVYLDTGYRNRSNLASVLDSVIASKLEEAEESGIYTKKDIVDLLTLAHKMRMDELKAQNEYEKSRSTTVKNQTNVQINEGIPFGQGNYGKLMEKLIGDGET